MAQLLLPSGKKLTNIEELVPQERLDRLYERMWSRGQQAIVELVTFVAYVMPKTDKVPEEMAYFRVISEHPKKRFPDQKLETIANMPLSQWREAEDIKWRFAGSPDPLLAIFAGLVKKHMETYDNLKALNN